MVRDNKVLENQNNKLYVTEHGKQQVSEVKNLMQAQEYWRANEMLKSIRTELLFTIDSFGDKQISGNNIPVEWLRKTGNYQVADFFEECYQLARNNREQWKEHNIKAGFQPKVPNKETAHYRLRWDRNKNYQYCECYSSDGCIRLYDQLDPWDKYESITFYDVCSGEELYCFGRDLKDTNGLSVFESYFDRMLDEIAETGHLHFYLLR